MEEILYKAEEIVAPSSRIIPNVLPLNSIPSEITISITPNKEIIKKADFIFVIFSFKINFEKIITNKGIVAIITPASEEVANFIPNISKRNDKTGENNDIGRIFRKLFRGLFNLIIFRKINKLIQKKAIPNLSDKKYIGFIYSKAIFENKNVNPNITEEKTPAK